MRRGSAKGGIDPLAGLNEEQRRAVLATEGPVLVLAGAGSGKTRVLAHRIAYIVERKLARPWQILAVTFTNKAARELKERVARIVAKGGDEVTAGTFHSVFLRMLRREAKALGYPKDFTVFDNDDSVRLVKLILKERGENRFTPRSIHSAISRLKNDMIPPREVAQSADSPREELVAAVYEEYERRLRRHAGMDFDDLLLKPIDLFREHPSVLNDWSARWRYLHVDEMQDTNLAQFELLRLLAGPKPNLFAVGDDDQSIYGWRGARVENIFRFRESFPGTKVFRLERNYRSTQAILDLAHAVVEKSSRREKKKLWTERTGGAVPQVIQFPTDLDEAQEVADIVGREVLSGRRRYRDFAVLYRTNAQSRTFEDILRARRYPYQVIGSLGFYERREVRDAIAYAKLCLNPRDDIALRRIIGEPPRGIGASTIERLVAWATGRDLPLTDALKRADEIEGVAKRSVNACREFAEQIQQWREKLPGMVPNEWMQMVLEGSGYLRRLRDEGGFEAQGRLDNLDAFINSLADAAEEGASLADFLEQAALMTDVDRYQPEDDSVRLMTLHASKGLEFPVVFITGLDEGLFPLANGMNEVLNPDEERRLFYVGVTRAKEELFLTHVTQRRRWGSPVLSEPSPFLLELPRERIHWRVVAGTAGSIFGKRHVSLKETRGGSGYDSPTVRTTGAGKTRKRDGSSRPAAHHGADDIPAVRPGDLVEHHLYGRGIVVSTTPMRNDVKVRVEFGDGEQRLMVQSIARLQPVKDFR